VTALTSDQFSWVEEFTVCRPPAQNNDNDNDDNETTTTTTATTQYYYYYNNNYYYYDYFVLPVTTRQTIHCAEKFSVCKPSVNTIIIILNR